MSLLRDEILMSVEDFVGFLEDRPDDERWELIDGEPILSPSPSYGHQKVVRNLLSLLIVAEDGGSAWEMLPGLGVRLSDHSMPVPDVVVRPRTRINGHFCDDMLAAFEVLSPASRVRDLRWKREAYTALPSLRHYVVLHQDRAEMLAYDRSVGWAERRLTGPGAALRLEGLDLTLPASALYAGTGLLP